MWMRSGPATDCEMLGTVGRPWEEKPLLTGHVVPIRQVSDLPGSNS